MKRFLMTVAAAAFTLGLAGTASADSAWMTESGARNYGKVHLGPSATIYPSAIECKVVEGKIMIRFKTRSGQKPFAKWQFAVSQNPLADMRRVSANYKIVSSSSVSGKKCALGYRK